MLKRVALRLATLWKGEPRIVALPPASEAFACFRIGPMTGGTLGIESAASRQVAISASAGGVVAVIPAALPHLCFLVASDGLALSVAGDDLRAVAISLRLLRTDKALHVRLRHPLGQSAFLCAEAGAGSRLHLQGAGTTIAAVFRLTAMHALDVPAGAHAIAAEIGVAAAGRLAADTMLASLRAGRFRPALAQALVRAMARAELDELARLLLADPASLALLRAAMPDDPWLLHALPDLAAWNLSRRPVSPGDAAASPASDEAQILPTAHARPIPAGLALQALARRQIRPRRGAAILVTVRNEGPYLLDWIAYHLSIGFEHIFLYSNENNDGSDRLLAQLARHGVITWIDNARTPQVGPQDKAYTHALTLLPQILDFRWLAILDIDEYLAFDTAMFDGIGDVIALQEAQAVDAIALCWVMFGCLPGEGWSDQPTFTRFARRQRDINTHVKSLIRPQLFWFSQPHFPTATFGDPFVYRTEDGRLHHHAGTSDRLAAFAEHPSANQTWINHYILRSAPEAALKWSRGRASWLPTDRHGAFFAAFVAQTFLDLAQPDTLMEDRRIEACARGHPAMLDRLLGLPGVSDCHAEIQAQFPAHMRRAVDDFLAFGDPATMSAQQIGFRALLEVARGGVLKA